MSTVPGLYEYRGYDVESGRPVWSTVLASSQQEIVTRYGRSMDIDYVRPLVGPLAALAKTYIWRRVTGQYVPAKAIVEFVKNFGKYYAVRAATDELWSDLIKSSSNRRLRTVLRAMAYDISVGKLRVSQACAARPREFPAIVVTLLEAAEDGGKLDTLLPQLGEILADSMSFRKEFRKALGYPLFLLASLLVGGVWIGAFIANQAEQSTQQLQYSGILLRFVDLYHFVANPVTIAVFLSMLAGLYVGLALWRGTPAGAMLIDRMMLSRWCPWGRVLRKSYAQPFALVYGVLRKVRLPGEALERAIPVTGSPYFVSELSDVAVVAATGKAPLSELLAATSLFDEEFVNALRTGEQTTRVPEQMAEQADRLRDEVRESLQRAANSLRVGMIYVVAIVTGLAFLPAAISIYTMSTQQVQTYGTYGPHR